MRRWAALLGGVLIAAAGVGGAGCGVSPEALMVTPELYRPPGLDPFDHLDEAHRTDRAPVFYATNRARAGHGGTVRYGNGRSATLALGSAVVRFGEALTWEDLHRASRMDPRDEEIILGLDEVRPMATIEARPLADKSGRALYEGHRDVDAFVASVNAALASADDPEILVYVHGAKVDFYNACVFSAELDHFAGRDFVSVAFAWPTHQDIFAYLFGADVERARESAAALESLLQLLAERTEARRINILCWSAGARVTAKALDEIAEFEDQQAVDPSTLRLGAVVFAAPDIPVHTFLERLPNIERVAERVVITASDDDSALEAASLFMGGGPRLGTLEEGLSEEEAEAVAASTRVEVIDVSAGSVERGFDITGHRYWFRHSWVASDIILTLRARLPAEQRGLAPGRFVHVWSLPPDYPERVRDAATRALGASW